MKISPVFSFMVALSFPCSAAVSLTASTTAPVVGANDQASLNDLATVPGGAFNSQAFSDNAGPPGQTFTTGSASNYSLTSFTFKGAATGASNFGGFSGTTTWGIRISSVSGTTLTPINTVTGIAHPSGTINGDEWFTWIFTGADLLTLAPSTTYSFEAFSSAGYLGFDASDTTTAYAGGTAFNSTGTARAFSSNTLQDRLYDRTFVAALTPVTEPAAISSLLAGLAVFSFGRRRRSTGSAGK